MTIYLYVKEHNTTGLKYLGYTKSSDPYSYPGSGVRWRNHLNKHGYDFTTTILVECSSIQEIKEWGRHYSQLWNVVESPEWANLKTEEGQGGQLSEESKRKIGISNTGKIRDTEYRANMSTIKKGQKYGPQSEQHKRNNALAKKGRPQPKDAIERRTLKRAGRTIWNNGIINVFAAECPQGYVKGRVKKARPNKWFTNGITNVLSPDCPEGFRPGKTHKNRC